LTSAHSGHRGGYGRIDLGVARRPSALRRTDVRLASRGLRALTSAHSGHRGGYGRIDLGVARRPSALRRTNIAFRRLVPMKMDSPDQVRGRL